MQQQRLLSAISQQRYQRDISNIQIRDDLVQRFEFTYEISHKMLKRYLEHSSASPEQFDQMPFADLIRSDNEQGLLQSDWPVWRGYRDMRLAYWLITIRQRLTIWLVLVITG
ncbi:nucleotidyltransferase substrate binding protein [Arsukibacterium sp.]|uniref:nucleotidyltransferase substrate binding protein n=1 Tax=Arsukibacterium sp. TaxID=1977258 RepID=UPI002FD8B5FA